MNLNSLDALACLTGLTSLRLYRQAYTMGHGFEELHGRAVALALRSQIDRWKAAILESARQLGVTAYVALPDNLK